MQRYFFHQFRSGKRIEDPEGSVHGTLDSARQEALTSALELMVSRLWKGEDPNHSWFEITDVAGNVVLIVHFAEAMDRAAADGRGGENDLRQASAKSPGAE